MSHQPFFVKKMPPKGAQRPRPRPEAGGVQSGRIQRPDGPIAQRLRSNSRPVQNAPNTKTCVCPINLADSQVRYLQEFFNKVAAPTPVTVGYPAKHRAQLTREDFIALGEMSTPVPTAGGDHAMGQRFQQYNAMSLELWERHFFKCV